MQRPWLLRWFPRHRHRHRHLRGRDRDHARESSSPLRCGAALHGAVLTHNPRSPLSDRQICVWFMWVRDLAPEEQTERDKEKQQAKTPAKRIWKRYGKRMQASERGKCERHKMTIVAHALGGSGEVAVDVAGYAVDPLPAHGRRLS